jgi:hypothetical protein
MPSLPLQQAVSSSRQAKPVHGSARTEAPPRSTRIGKGLAAFLLGLMLGVTGIVLGQSAFHDLAGDQTTVELRR